MKPQTLPEIIVNNLGIETIKRGSNCLDGVIKLGIASPPYREGSKHGAIGFVVQTVRIYLDDTPAVYTTYFFKLDEIEEALAFFNDLNTEKG